jgi:hypothetical protein
MSVSFKGVASVSHVPLPSKPFPFLSLFFHSWTVTLAASFILERHMRPAFTIFILFFGIAFLDAVRGGHWPRVFFWVVIGLLFFLADRTELWKDFKSSG